MWIELRVSSEWLEKLNSTDTRKAEKRIRVLNLKQSETLNRLDSTTCGVERLDMRKDSTLLVNL